MKNKFIIILLVLLILVPGFILAGPWRATGRNYRLCNITLTNETEELLLIHKKGKFRSWMYNSATDDESRYTAYPADWYKERVVEKKVRRGWILENITEEDQRVTMCNITAGKYLIRFSGKTCYSYCVKQPHLDCKGHWELSGIYPDCNCTYICDEEVDTNPPNITAPNITIYEPTEGGNYSKRVPINISLTKEARYLKYSDNGKNYKRLCSKCDNYEGRKYFKKGFHNVTFMAVDELGNENYKSVTFNVN